MNFIVRHIKWVMLFSGVLTLTTFYGLFAPQAVLESMFGASFNGVLESIVIRSWSALVGLMGAVLIYGALRAQSRTLCISIAAFSKLVFVCLVVLFGQEFLPNAAPAIALDCVVVALAGLYLAAIRARG